MELDPGIWDIAKSEKVSTYFCSFVNIAKYNGKKKYFVKTKFHDYFSSVLKSRIESLEEEECSSLVGIQGVGKSSTIVYYVLTCIGNNDLHIHYIDMEVIKGESQMNRLKDYAKEMQVSDILIIDHVTLFNRHIVEKIKTLVPLSKILLVETGLSAIANRGSFGLQADTECQLNRNELKKIWIESLKKVHFNMNNADVFAKKLYDKCKGRFNLTPRMLQRVRSFIVEDGDLYDEKSKDVDFFLMRYRTSLANDITILKNSLRRVISSQGVSEEKQLCNEFSYHTKILFHLIKATGDIVFTQDQYDLLKTAINIFHSEYRKVSEEDLEDHRFLELGLKKGDKYIKVTQVMPELQTHWRGVFDFKIQDIIDNNEGFDISAIIEICFQNGGIRKELEYELVWLQYQHKTLIVPGIAIGSSCSLSDVASKCIVNQCNGVLTHTPNDIIFLQPSLSDLEPIKVEEEFRKHDRNLARLAVFLKKEVKHNKERSLLVYPLLEYLKGINYVLYTCTELAEVTNTPSKRRKVVKEYVLYLVQVVTGGYHTGVTIGDALNIFRKHIKNIPIHVMVIVARKERDSFTLNGNILFDNVSVVNLTHAGLYGIIKENKLIAGVVDLIKKS